MTENVHAVYSEAHIIEQMAREMAIADGKKPGDFVDNLFGASILHWRHYRREAALHLAAYRAMRRYGM